MLAVRWTGLSVDVLIFITLHPQGAPCDEMKHSPEKELVPGPQLAYGIDDVALNLSPVPEPVPLTFVTPHILRSEMTNQIQDEE